MFIIQGYRKQVETIATYTTVPFREGSGDLLLTQKSFFGRVVERDLVVKLANPAERSNILSLHNEVAILSTTSHSNIVRLVDHGTEPIAYLTGEVIHAPFLVLDAFDCDLHEGLEDGYLNSGDWRDVHAVLVGIAAGLAHLSALRIAHLDLKPSNVLLRRHDHSIRPVLCDFGQSARLGAPRRLSRPFLNKYLPPDAEASEKYDVYSFGAMMYELITGKDFLARIFGLETALEVRSFVPAEHRDALRHIVLNAITPEVGRRSSIEEVLIELPRLR